MGLILYSVKTILYNFQQYSIFNNWKYIEYKKIYRIFSQNNSAGYYFLLKEDFYDNLFLIEIVTMA